MQGAVALRSTGYALPRFSAANAVRLALAVMAVVAVPIDFNHRVLGPDPNWSLLTIEPVALVWFLRCTVAVVIRG
jgi:hypothetical protein